MKKVDKLANEIREFIKEEPVWIVDDILEILDKHAPVQKPFPKVMVHKDKGLIVFVKKDKVSMTVLNTGTGHSVGQKLKWCDNNGTEPITKGYEDYEFEEGQ